MKLWTLPGHPGVCPRCGSPHVRWVCKPDADPTTERATCYRCGWSEGRDFIPVPPTEPNRGPDLWDEEGRGRHTKNVLTDLL